MKQIIGMMAMAMLLVGIAAAPAIRPTSVDIGCRVVAPFTTLTPFAETPLPFNSATYDTDTMRNGARIYINTAGKYSFACTMRVSAILGGGTVFLFTRKNGTSWIESSEQAEPAGISISIVTIGENQFSAGDYLEFTYLIIAGNGSVSANAVVRKVD